MEFLCIMKLLPYSTLKGEREIWLETAACNCAVVGTRASLFNPSGHSRRKLLGFSGSLPSSSGKATFIIVLICQVRSC